MNREEQFQLVRRFRQRSRRPQATADDYDRLERELKADPKSPAATAAAARCNFRRTAKGFAPGLCVKPPAAYLRQGGRPPARPRSSPRREEGGGNHRVHAVIRLRHWIYRAGWGRRRGW